MQRCYDQLVHDVSLQKIKMLFAIDRAGFVGEDGETHNGLLDVAFLSTIPNLTVYSPCCFRSLYADIGNALYADEFSAAVRYPRGGQDESVKKLRYDCIDYSTFGDADAENAVVTYGRITAEAIKAVELLKQSGKSLLLVSLNRVKPLPEEAVDIITKKSKVWFFEEGVRAAEWVKGLRSGFLKTASAGNTALRQSTTNL